MWLRVIGMVCAAGVLAAGGCGGKVRESGALEGAGVSPMSGPAKGAADVELDRLVAMMTGSFASTAQHKADGEDYFDIRLQMARIWPERKDGVWLYVEQATATALAKPYRQRVYRVDRDRAAGAAGFVSEVYELPGGMAGALGFAGAYKDGPTRTALVALTPESLTKKDGCSVYLSASPDGSLAGGTRGQGCATTLRGAAYATSEVLVTDDLGPHGGDRLGLKGVGGLRTWDRGFDAAGAQAWGAEKGGYFFARVAE